MHLWLSIAIQGLTIFSIFYLMRYSLWWGMLLILPIVQIFYQSQCVPIVSIQQVTSHHWRLTYFTGETIIARFERSIFRSSFLMILKFKSIPSGESLVIPLYFDSLPNDNYRLLLNRLWE